MPDLWKCKQVGLRHAGVRGQIDYPLPGEGVARDGTAHPGKLCTLSHDQIDVLDAKSDATENAVTEILVGEKGNHPGPRPTACPLGGRIVRESVDA